MVRMLSQHLRGAAELCEKRGRAVHKIYIVTRNGNQKWKWPATSAPIGPLFSILFVGPYSPASSFHLHY